MYRIRSQRYKKNKNGNDNTASYFSELDFSYITDLLRWFQEVNKKHFQKRRKYYSTLRLNFQKLCGSDFTFTESMPAEKEKHVSFKWNCEEKNCHNRQKYCFKKFCLHKIRTFTKFLQITVMASSPAHVLTSYFLG